MNNDYLHTEPTLYLTKEYDEENPVDPDKLREVFCVAYKVAVNKPGVKDKDIYTFTTLFDQAFKRYKLLPYGKVTLMRFLTDDENLYQIALNGNAKQWKEEDITEEMSDQISLLKMSDICGTIKEVPEEGNNTNTVVNSVPAEVPIEEKNIEV